MLQAFRKHAYSWGIRALLVGLGAAMILFFGLGGGFFSHVRPVATVNCRNVIGIFTLPGCHQILNDDVNRESTNLRNAVANAYGKNAGIILKGLNLRQLAVEQLIQQYLVEHEAGHLGLTISNQELEKTIESQTAFQVNGRFNFQRYREILRSNDLEPATYEQETRGQMLFDTMQQMVENGVHVSREEAHHEFDLLGQNISLAYIEIPYSNFTGIINPSEKEVAAFYKENKEAFRQPARAKIILVRYSPSVLAAHSVPSERAIAAFYKQNLAKMFTHPEEIRVRHILIAVGPNESAKQIAAAHAKAEKILKEVQSGANFAKLAKEYSDDPGTKNEGGELGEITKGELVKPFQDVAFSLKPGQSAIARTQYGYHVIQVQSVTPAHIDSPDEARPQIIKTLEHKQNVELAQEYMEQDLTAALEGRTLQSLAKKRGLTAVETPFFTESETVEGAQDDPKLAQEVFKLKVGQIHAVTDAPVPYLIQLVARKPSEIPPLSDIKDQVRQMLIRTTAESQAHSLATSLLKMIKTPDDLAMVASQNHFQVQQTGKFPRASESVPGVGELPQVTEAAAGVPQIPGVINTVVSHDGNSFIFEVVDRTPPNDDRWKLAGSAFTQRLLQERRQAAWGNFINALKRDALIHINTDMLGQNSASGPA